MTTHDPEVADASQDDDKVQLTNNSPTDEDGPQDDVDQNPVSEDDVPDDEGGDNGAGAA